MSLLDTISADAKQVAGILNNPSQSANAGAALGGVLSYQFQTVQQRLAKAYNGLAPALRAFIPGLPAATSGPAAPVLHGGSAYAMPALVAAGVVILYLVLRGRR